MKNYKLITLLSVCFIGFISCNEKVNNVKSKSTLSDQPTQDELYRQRLIQDYKLIFLRDCIFDNLYDKEAKNAFYETDASIFTDFPHGLKNMRKLDSLLEQVAIEISQDSIYLVTNRFHYDSIPQKRVLLICAEYFTSEEFDAFVEKTIPK